MVGVMLTILYFLVVQNEWKRSVETKNEHLFLSIYSL